MIDGDKIVDKEDLILIILWEIVKVFMLRCIKVVFVYLKVFVFFFFIEVIM